MPFHAVCPECHASFDLPDTLQGQRVPCEQCGATFQADIPTVGAVKEGGEILDVLPAVPAKTGTQPGRLARAVEHGRRPPDREAMDRDELRPQSGSSVGLVIALAGVAAGFFVILAIGGAVFWALRARPAAPAPAPAPVVSAEPTPPPPPPEPPVTRRVRVKPAPAPIPPPVGQPKVSVPVAPPEELPIPPDPPDAVAVDWSGVERVALPDAGEARGVAADPAPGLEGNLKPGPFTLEARANEVHALLFPRARAQAVVASSRKAAQGKRVVRVERVDLTSGKGLGTFSLYGRTISNPIAMFAPAAAVSPDGSLFAQIDIDGRQRIDIWSLKDGKHVVGFVAPAGAAGGGEGRDRPRGPRGPRGSGRGGLLVRDLAFVDDEHLLVLSSPSIDSSPGQVVLWKVPEAKPVYRFDGTGMPWLSPSLGGKYLAADTSTGYALLEARTGKVVGRLLFPKERVLKAGMTGFDRSGTRFAAELTMFEGHGGLPGHRLVCWDLGTGAMTHSFAIQMPLLLRGLQWFGDSTIFMGWNLLGLEYKKVVVRYSVPGALATTSPDGRLWYTAAPGDNQPALLWARAMPDDAVRKVTEALREKKGVPVGADFVPLTGEK